MKGLGEREFRVVFAGVKNRCDVVRVAEADTTESGRIHLVVEKK